MEVLVKAEVLNWEGQKLSEVDLNPVFFQKDPDLSLLQRAVVWQQAGRRRGTHKSKSRGEVSGGGKKPFRQKGTGRARQGSNRSPLLRGGGVIHGPRPRSYAQAFPKQLRCQALRNALIYMFQKQRLIFVEDMKSPEGKTKEISQRFQKMGWDKALLVDEDFQDLFQRACRNLKGFKCLPARALNVYDILKYDRLAVVPSVLQSFYKKCGFFEFSEKASSSGREDGRLPKEGRGESAKDEVSVKSAKDEVSVEGAKENAEEE